uniref:C-type lectin domain-containing protein n=1 Tax=Ornithorhynchus anatinus TaxID=9258 RepID=A0A6I8NJH8_ORNAN
MCGPEHIGEGLEGLTLHCDLSVFSTGRSWDCCSRGWRPFQSRCYFISADKMSWDQSQQNCHQMGAHLVVISSDTEQKFLESILDNKAAYFLGLTYLEVSKDWRWVDQTPYNKSVLFWHAGEPNYKWEHCGSLHWIRNKGWGWNNILCDIKQNRICEMAGSHF